MTTSGTDEEPTVGARRVRAWAVLAPLALVVLAARLVGTSSLVSGLSLGGPPLIGHWHLTIPPSTVVPVLLGAGLVAGLPVAAERLRWMPLLCLGWVASAAFATILAAVDGWGAVSAPLEGRFEYRAALDDVERLGAGDFTATFVDQLSGYPTHVRGHPVGATLVFWVQEQVGLVGAGWAAAIVIAAGTSTVVSVAIATRAVAGGAVARRAVPFLVAVPALVWVATSADALFSGVIAAAVACFAVSAAGRGRRADIVAVAGGIAAAVALHLSYGAAVMLLPAAVIVVGQRRVRPLVVGVAGVAAVTAAFVAAGFWWFDGLEATRAEYARGAGGVRPFWYFATLGNPGAFLLALGPAVPVALARLRDRRVWLVAGGALAGVIIANTSGLSKAEVERIWLPFVPWLAAATAVFPVASARWWLAAQVMATVALQLALESPW